MALRQEDAGSDGWVPEDGFGIRLRVLRARMGNVTVDEISEQCEIASATWSTWENGAMPRNYEEVVRKIVKGTKVNGNWLAWGIGGMDGVTVGELELLCGGCGAPDCPWCSSLSLSSGFSHAQAS